ncbi:hypothetical protein [Kamptonema formosum]|uniref:hypothetical protein n=1 Tax=Kamptonema formosum TaxID=331992 RepID=UPI0003452474|nr:hypothetical protein [Oscillatoria sp. PCC 10802]
MQNLSPQPLAQPAPCTSIAGTQLPAEENWYPGESSANPPGAPPAPRGSFQQVPASYVPVREKPISPPGG